MAGHPPDATWCTYLAYDIRTDGFYCADERANRVLTQRLDLAWCPYLIKSIQGRTNDVFTCAEKGENGILKPRQWILQETQP